VLWHITLPTITAGFSVPEDEPYYAGRAGLSQFVKDDPIAGSVIADLSHMDVNGMAANVETLLKKPELQPIEDEWNKAKKKKRNPEWYSLSTAHPICGNLRRRSGQSSRNVRVSVSHWSNEVHAAAS